MVHHKINDLINRYKNLGKLIETSIKKQGKVSNIFIKIKILSKLALDIFIEIAKISNLDLETVSLKKEAMEYKEKVLLKFTTIPRIPEFGDIEISNTEGTVIFVDITKSTDYFKEEKNYTGFVIFNAYILLVKTITELTGGEFLEHTGDGAMIFYRNRNLIKEYIKCKGFDEGNPICLYFIVSEYVKNYAKNKGLLSFESSEGVIYAEIKDLSSFKSSKEVIFTIEPALVHIGAAYGEVLEVDLGDMKKLISKTVWDAANRCKYADRKVAYKYESDRKTYYKLQLPIKIY